MIMLVEFTYARPHDHHLRRRILLEEREINPTADRWETSGYRLTHVEPALYGPHDWEVDEYAFAREVEADHRDDWCLDCGGRGVCNCRNL